MEASPLSIVDMRGKTIMLPRNLQRIATIDDGLIEEVFTCLGEINKGGYLLLVHETGLQIPFHRPQGRTVGVRQRLEYHEVLHRKQLLARGKASALLTKDLLIELYGEVCALSTIDRLR